jgi:hypothetical protein
MLAIGVRGSAWPKAQRLSEATLPVRRACGSNRKVNFVRAAVHLVLQQACSADSSRCIFCKSLHSKAGVM